MNLSSYSKEVEWNDFGSLSAPQTYSTASSVNDKIFLIGGLYEDESFARDVKIWDGEWVTTTVQFSIHHACSFVNEGNIFIFGGSTEKDDYQTRVRMLDPDFPDHDQLVNSGYIGVKGYFGGRNMRISNEKGAVFAEDGELVCYDDFSCTFTKSKF